MRTLLAAAMLAAMGGLATAQTLPPAPPAAAGQTDAARKAWFAHAIDHLLDGRNERADRSVGHPTLAN